MGIRRGTTPTVALIVHADIVGWTIVVTLECGNELYDFTDEDITAEHFELDGESCTLVRVPLTQPETLALQGRCRLQVRAVSQDGLAVASCIRSTRAEAVLNATVIGG